MPKYLLLEKKATRFTETLMERNIFSETFTFWETAALIDLPGELEPDRGSEGLDQTKYAHTGAALAHPVTLSAGDRFPIPVGAVEPTRLPQQRLPTSLAQGRRSKRKSIA